MRFYYILHKNSIGHLFRTSRDYICPPPPKVLEKYRTLSNIIFEFVVLLTKIWAKNIDFHRNSLMLERGLFFAPLPPLHQDMIHALKVVLFYNYLY